MSHLLHRAVFAAFLLVVSAAHGVTRPATGLSAADLLLDQANQDRVANSLPELRKDPLLAQAALYHAYQMARHADISHGFPGEPDLSERGASTGAHFSLITENVAEAGSPSIIHGLWMNSPGHRANLLDPEVNAVGIAVVTQDSEVFAVEDFASLVEPMSIDQQESSVAKLLTTTGITVANTDAKIVAGARQTCSMPVGFAGVRQPWFVMRYTSARLSELPPQIRTRLTSGKYHQAVVGACSPSGTGVFNSYTIAILLYP